MTTSVAKPYSWQQVSMHVDKEDVEHQIQVNSESLPSPWAEIDVRKEATIKWRVSNFTCAPLPPQLYGDFYAEDVYLFVRVQPKPKKKKKDPPTAALVVYMWVGKMASEDDYKSGLWFLAEMDKKFADVVIIREAQEMESAAFKQYFKTITYWKGSFSDSLLMCMIRGVNYRAKLLKLSSDDRVPGKLIAKEIPCKMSELDPAFTFALDIGHSIYLWHGDLTPTDDDIKAIDYMETIKTDRGCETNLQVLDDDTDPGQHPFYTYLSKASYKTDDIGDGTGTLNRAGTLSRQQPPIELYRPVIRKSTASPTSQFDCVKKGKIQQKDLEQYPITLLSTPEVVFIQLDKKCSADLGFRGLARGHEFLSQSKLPLRSLVLLRYKQTHPLLSKYISK